VATRACVRCVCTVTHARARAHVMVTYERALCKLDRRQPRVIPMSTGTWGSASTCVHGSITVLVYACHRADLSAMARVTRGGGSIKMFVCHWVELSAMARVTQGGSGGGWQRLGYACMHVRLRARGVEGHDLPINGKVGVRPEPACRPNATKHGKYKAANAMNSNPTQRDTANGELKAANAMNSTRDGVMVPRWPAVHARAHTATVGERSHTYHFQTAPLTSLCRG